MTDAEHLRAPRTVGAIFCQQPTMAGSTTFDPGTVAQRDRSLPPRNRVRRPNLAFKPVDLGEGSIRRRSRHLDLTRPAASERFRPSETRRHSAGDRGLRVECEGFEWRTCPDNQADLLDVETARGWAWGKIDYRSLSQGQASKQLPISHHVNLSKLVGVLRSQVF